ncbi:MAG TPA: transferrin receptor-like dimerization domain-containing protein, partial [Candidatus Dormibacteraeota bacterium]|nr:transferrin receptor-like dimerization domain-containing protein [Candidatus Dormibacteraeota bacterium]
TAGPEGLSFSPAAVASLAPMLVEASKDVRAPSGKSLYEAWRATSKRDDRASAPPLDSALVETRIGSGSDHTVFLNHLGRPVINMGFTGDYGVYHSMYDDHYWMENIGDPSFEYHVALTRIWGLIGLRLANADVPPYDFGFNGLALDHFLTELELRSKVDPHKLKLKKLHERIADFQKAGSELREAVQRELAVGRASTEKEDRLDQQLLQVESNWLDHDGIPRRPWFQHLIYASRYTYAHLEFPGLTEAVEKGDWKLASEQAELIERALTKNIELLRKAKASWEKNN